MATVERAAGPVNGSPRFKPGDRVWRVRPARTALHYGQCRLCFTAYRVMAVKPTHYHLLDWECRGGVESVAVRQVDGEWKSDAEREAVIVNYARGAVIKAVRAAGPATLRAVAELVGVRIDSEP